MADNVTLPLTGTGDATAAVATDDVGGSHYQRVKVDLGGDGVASPLVRGQQTATNSIPVTIASDQSAVTIADGGGSITVDGAGTSSAFTAAVPADGTAAGYSDGANMQLARVFDLHTGGSTEYVLGVNLRFGAGSGSLEAGTSGNPLRVSPTGTVAQPVTDNGGSLTVDGSVDVTSIVPGTGATNLGKAEDAAHTSGDTGVMALAVQQAADSAFGADGDYGPLQLDANGFLKVNIKAGAGSGGTASTDDAAFTAGAGSGTPMMGFASSDVVDSGDVGVLRMTTTRDLMVTLRDSAGDSAMDDANNALRVNVVAGSSGGPSLVDDAAFTVATDSVAPMGALADDTATDSVDEGDVGIPRMTLDRKLLMRIAGATDANRLDIDGSGHAQVDIAAFSVALPSGTNNIGDVDVLTVPAPLSTTGGGTEATALRVTVASDSTGVLSVDDNGSTISVDDGAGSLTVDGTVSISGTVTVDSELPTAAALADNTANPTVPAVGAFNMVWDGSTWDRAAGTSADGALVNLGANNDVTVTGTVTANAGTGTFTVGGVAAHDAAISGNPVRIGARAATTDLTAVAAGDAVDLVADTGGKQVVLVGSVQDRRTSGTTNYTNSTAADVIAAAGAGVRIAVTSILVTNAHATQGTKVEIRDGTTVKIIGYGAAVGGGFALNSGGSPLFISTANTAVTARCVTTGADVDVSISGYLTT